MPAMSGMARRFLVVAPVIVMGSLAVGEPANGRAAFYLLAGFLWIAAAMLWVELARSHEAKAQATSDWADRFVEQFVVAPSADAPDFALQSMPKLESLAYAYNRGLVDRSAVMVRLSGDLSGYRLELELFLMDCCERQVELEGAAGYSELRAMLRMDEESVERQVRAEHLRRHRERFRRSTSTQKGETGRTTDLILEAAKLKQGDAPESEGGETVVFEPNDKLYREFDEIFGRNRDEKETPQ